jgi:hypothetical protein
MNRGNMIYHVEVVVKKTGSRFRMTSDPVSRHEAETISGKITVYKWRRIEIVEEE